MSFMLKSAWPIDRVNKLGGLLAAGYSASQAAAEMGCTRNSIIGVAHRKKLVFRFQSAVGRPKAPRTTKTATPRRSTPFRPQAAWRELKPPTPLPFTEPAGLPLVHRCSLLELTKDSCRWPHGDVGDADFFFCGGPAAEGAPYCLDHCRISYRRPGQVEAPSA